ncbi:hypothetical protein HMPREF9946_03260 [Acetobacteraceae bacterium AT-5844]|nr:hypothetical protein HMPREF9946_03260 [Acetobacteraceae bacterium AT-5844]
MTAMPRRAVTGVFSGENDVPASWRQRGVMSDVMRASCRPRPHEYRTARKDWSNTRFADF